MYFNGYMTYFNVEHCGLYKIKGDKCLGLDLSETFDKIMDWVQDRPLSTTIPWDPNTTRDNKPKVYCKHVYKDPKTGHFLIVLWKSDHHSSGTMWGVDENEASGSDKIVKTSTKHRGKNVIWGRPCYYWIIPEYKAVVSIKFDHSLCDAELFKDFVKHAITNRVKHDGKYKLSENGYARIAHNSTKYNEVKCLYRFSMVTKSLATDNVSLQKLVNSITHVITRDTIVVNGKNDRADFVNKFNSLFPATTLGKKIKEKRIEVIAESRPSMKEVKELIEKHAKDNRKPCEWNNIGFSTDKGTVWIDKYRLRDEIVILADEEQYFPADVLYSHIYENINRYIQPLKKEQAKMKKKLADIKEANK